MRNREKYKGFLDIWRFIEKDLKMGLIAIVVQPKSEIIYKQMFEYFKINYKIQYIEDSTQGYEVKFYFNSNKKY